VESVIFGIYHQVGDWAGKTVAEIRDELESLWALPPDAVAFCGSQRLPDQSIMAVGGRIEFHRRSHAEPIKLLVCDLCGDSLVGSAYVTDDQISGWRRYCVACWEGASWGGSSRSDTEDRDGAIAELVEILATAGAATIEGSDGNDQNPGRQSGS
jgi:hypothetical protein